MSCRDDPKTIRRSTTAERVIVPLCASADPTKELEKRATELASELLTQRKIEAKEPKPE